MKINASLVRVHDNSTTINQSQDEEDATELTLILSFLGIVGVLIVLANGTVFFLTARRAYLRTKTNAILVSLAASDFLAGILCVPLIITCTSVTRMVVCTAMELSQRFLAISTILHLLVAAVERYLKIVLPLRYLSILSDRKVAFVLSVIWVVSLFSSLIQLAWMGMNEEEEDELSHDSDAIYSLFCMIAFVLTPFVVMVLAYAHIFYVIRRERRTRSSISRSAKKRRKHEIRAVFIYIAMVVIFLLAWSGYFIASFIADIGSDILSRLPWLNVLLMFLKFSTAFINPLLYTFFKADFQNALGSFRKKAPNLLSATTQLVSLNTLANLGIQRNSPSICKYDGIGTRSRSVPNSFTPQQKTTRSKSLAVYVSNV